MRWSPTKISRAESGRESLPPDEVAKLLDYYGIINPLRGQLLALAGEAAQRGWWENYADVLSPDYMEYIGLEVEATSMSHWQSDAVPGLLQTEDYARQLQLAYQRVIPTTPPSAVERVVRVRMTRQRRLTHEPLLRFSTVIDEAVLLRKVGDRDLMRGQLEHLIQAAELPNVDLRILSLNQEASLALTPFVIFSFGSPVTPDVADLSDIVSTETLTRELIEDEIDTHLHRLFFRALTSASLSPEDSQRLLISTMDRVWARH